MGAAAAGGIPGSNPRSPVFRTSLSRSPPGEGELHGACWGHLTTPRQIPFWTPPGENGWAEHIYGGRQGLAAAQNDRMGPKEWCQLLVH